jgi:pimeloyl-ACP methyl ester carboxylesterase
MVTQQCYDMCYNETPLRKEEEHMPAALPLETASTTGSAARIRWAGLAGREHGDEAASGRPLVLLHGLTFDRRMWDPLLEVVPDRQRVIAFDLPGHGGSPPLSEPGLAPVVEAIHEAVLAAGIDRPILVGHSIGGPLAAIYAATFPAAAVVSIENPIRVEPFAELLASIRPQLMDGRFDEVWAPFQQSMQINSVPPAQRQLLRAGDRASQQVVLSYQADLLEQPLEDVLRWRDSGLSRLRENRTPYITLHANPVDDADRAWLADRLPQAEVVVWPVGHHFPHLAHPARLAALLAGLQAVTAVA